MTAQELSNLAFLIHAVACRPRSSTYQVVMEHLPQKGSRSYVQALKLVLSLSRLPGGRLALSYEASALIHGPGEVRRAVGRALEYSLGVHGRTPFGSKGVR